MGTVLELQPITDKMWTSAIGRKFNWLDRHPDFGSLLCFLSCAIFFGVFPSLDLHHEIENLRAQLLNRNSLIGQLESEFSESRDYADQEICGLRDELAKLRDRYDRLVCVPSALVLLADIDQWFSMPHEMGTRSVKWGACFICCCSCRLLESHKKLQRLNHNLEDKLLTLVCVTACCFCTAVEMSHLFLLIELLFFWPVALKMVKVMI